MSGCLNVRESPPGLTDRATLERPSFHLNIKQRVMVMAQPQRHRPMHLLFARKDSGRKDDTLHCFL